MIGFDDWKNKKSVTGYDSWKHEKVKSAKAVKPISSEPDDEDVYDLAASLLTQTQSKPATAPAAPRMSALDRGYGGVDTSKRATSVNDLSRDDLRVKSALGAAASGVGSGYSNALSTLMDAAEALENKYRVADAPDTHIAQERSFISKPLDAEASRKKNETAIQILRNKADELSAKSEAQTESAKDGLGWIGKTAVDVGITGTQMLSDAAAAALTGGGSALAPMAVRVFGQGAQKARQSGANLQKQIGYGAASAAVEVATEKLWGGLAGLYGKGFNDDAAKAIVKDFAQKVTTRPAGQAAIMLLADIGGEGMEEIISGAIDPALQSIYNGKSVRENYADMDISEVAYEGFIGALLGGIGGAVELPGNYAEAKAAISRTEKNAQQFSPPVRSDDVLRTAAMEVAAAQDEQDGEQTMVERLVQPSNASLEATVPPPSKDTQDTVATVRNATYNDTGDSVQINGVSSVEDGVLYVALSDGSTASISDITINDPDIGQLYNEAEKYDTQGAKAFVQNYDGSASVNNYTRAFDSVYKAAKAGMSYEKIATNSLFAQNYLSQSARESAFASGLNAEKQQASSPSISKHQEREVVPAQTAAAQGGVVRNFTRKLSRSQEQSIRAIDAVAKSIGRTVSIVENLEGKDGNAAVNVKEEHGSYTDGTANAYFDPRTNEYTISLNGVGEAYIYFALHENIHDIAANNKIGYDNLEQVVFGVLKGKGADVDALVSYQVREFGYDEATAREEVVANTVPAILTDKKTADMFIDRIIGSDAETRTAFEKIIDSIMAFLHRMYDALKGEKSWAQMELVKGNMDAINSMREAYFAALEDLRSEVQAEGSESSMRLSAKDARTESIKEQIDAKKGILNSMNPVATITSSARPRRNGKPDKHLMRNALAAFFGSYNYSVDSADAGIVVFDKKALGELVHYIESDAEFAAVKAAPSVIKKGRLVNHHTEHKGRSDVESFTFAAPVVLNGVRGNEGVVVQTTNRSKPHCVRIVMPNGAGFDLTPIEKAAQDHSAAITRIAGNSSLETASKQSVPQGKGSVKDTIRKNGENDAKTASYTAERITSLTGRYGSSNPTYSKAYVAYISPADFISLTTTNPDKIAARAKPLDIDELRGETQEMFLQFDQDTGEVTGHEGRHRMQALLNEGIDRVAVTLIPDGEKGRYNRARIANVKLTGQMFNGRVAPGEVTIGEALPLSKEYEQEVREKFGQDSAVKFSMKEPVEESNGLIAVHNLSDSKLTEALRLGGFPMPSIAITKASIGHENFGDISLVFGKDSINPTDRRNKIYGGDAWTPTRPSIGYKLNENVRKSIEDRVKSLLDGTSYASDYRLMLDDNNMHDKITRLDGDYKRAYSDNNALRVAFLKDKDIPFSPVMQEKQYSYYADNVTLGRLNEEIDGGAVSVLHDSKRVMDYEPLIRKLINDRYEEQGQRRILDKELSFGRVDGIITSAASYAKAGAKQVVDDSATASRIDDAFNEQRMKEYEAWLDDLFNGIIEKRGLRNSKDWFTPSGNRRSFEQLYMEYNLENIVKAMAQEPSKGGGILGTGNIFGASTRDYSSVSDVKRDAYRLVNENEEEHKAKHDAFLERMQSITESMIKQSDNAFGATLDAGDAVVDSLLRGKTPKGILRELKTWARFNATEAVAQEIYDLANDISNEPVSYFEAKPRRAVGIGEIRLAVLPEDKYDSLKNQLQQHGITVEEYNPSVDGDRLRALNSEPGKRLHFSLKDVSPVDTAAIVSENEKLKATNELLSQQLQLTDGHRVSDKALDKLAGKMLSQTRSSYSRSDLTTGLKSMFDYLANSDTPVWNEVQDYGTGLAKKVLLESRYFDADAYNEYSSFRKYLRDSHFRLTSTQAKDIRYADGSLRPMLRSVFGRIKLSETSGTYLDVAWDEISYMSMGLIPPDTNEGDMPYVLRDALDTVKKERFYINEYGYGMDEAAYDLFLQMYDAYFDIPEVKTFADKKAKELALIKAKYRNMIAEMRADSKERYNARLKKLRAENVSKRKDISRQYNEILEQEKLLSRMVEGRARMEERNQKAKELALQKAKLQERYKKLSDRKNEQLLTQRAQFQEWKTADRARRAQKAEAKRLRTKITNRANELRKMLASPKLKEGKYVPDFLREPVIELLSGLDFTGEKGGVGAQTKWHSAMTRLYEEYKNYALAHSPDSSTQQLATNAAKYMNIQLMIHEAFLPIFQDFLESSKKVGDISNLSNAELKQLETLLNGVYANIRDVNRLYKNRRFANADIAGDAAIAYSENIRGTKDWRYLNSIRRFLSIDMLDSFSWGARMGEAGESIINELSTGLEKSYTRIREASEFFEQLKNRSGVKDSDIQSWTVATHNITLESGKTIVMSTAQLMEFYALCNRPQAMQHILKGGIEIDDIKQASKLIQQKGSYSITENDVSSLVGLLSEKQRGLIDGMQKFMSTQVAGWGNETTQELYMTDMYREPKYWTIRASRSSINTEDPAQIRAFNAVMNSSFTKSTNKYAGNPITIGDAFQTFGDHISGMAVYNGLALPIDDAMKWLNYRQRDEDGAIVQNANTKLAIDNVLGNAGQQYLINLIKDLNGLNSSGYSVQLSNKLLSNFKKASVAGKLRVVVQQPVSIFRALSEIDGRYLLAATFKRHSIEEMQKYAPIAWWKSKGNYEIGTGRSLRSVIIGDDTAYQKFVNGAMQPAGLADDATWAHIWEAAKLEVREKNKDLTGEAYMEKVAERFSSIVNRTQVVDTIMHRSQAMRSQDTAVKQATAFMSEPTKTYNMLLNAAFAVANSKGPAKAAALKRLAKVAAAWVLTETAHAAVLALHDSLRDRDDEESILDKWLESFAKNVKDGINPLDLIPYVRDVVSAIDGYDSSNMEVEAIGEIVDAVRAWNKFFAGEGNKTPYGLASASVKAISDLTGAPFGGLLASAEAIINGIAPGTLAKKEDTSVSAHVENLYAAHVAGREKQMNNALDSISEIYSKKLADKVKEGKTYIEAQKEARSSVLSSCTSVLKPLYLEAETTAEKIAIRTLAYRIRIGNQQLYNGYDFNRNWK